MVRIISCQRWAVICGEPSGNTYIIDFDVPDSAKVGVPGGRHGGEIPTSRPAAVTVAKLL